MTNTEIKTYNDLFKELGIFDILDGREEAQASTIKKFAKVDEENLNFSFILSSNLEERKKQGKHGDIFYKSDENDFENINKNFNTLTRLFNDGRTNANYKLRFENFKNFFTEYVAATKNGENVLHHENDIENKLSFAKSNLKTFLSLDQKIFTNFALNQNFFKIITILNSCKSLSGSYSVKDVLGSFMTKKDNHIENLTSLSKLDEKILEKLFADQPKLSDEANFLIKKVILESFFSEKQNKKLPVLLKFKDLSKIIDFLVKIDSRRSSTKFTKGDISFQNFSSDNYFTLVSLFKHGSSHGEKVIKSDILEKFQEFEQKGSNDFLNILNVCASDDKNLITKNDKNFYLDCLFYTDNIVYNKENKRLESKNKFEKNILLNTKRDSVSSSNLSDFFDKKIPKINKQYKKPQFDEVSYFVFCYSFGVILGLLNVNFFARILNQKADNKIEWSKNKGLCIFAALLILADIALCCFIAYKIICHIKEERSQGDFFDIKAINNACSRISLEAASAGSKISLEASSAVISQTCLNIA